MVSPEQLKVLKQLPIFEGIDEMEISFLASKFDFQSYAEDEIILNGSAFEDKNCYFIHSGMVRVVKAVPTNTEVSYYDLEAPMGFGLKNAFIKSFAVPENTMIVSAATPVTLFSIRQGDCDAMLHESPKILLNFARFVIMSYQKISLPAEVLMNSFRKTAS